MGCLLPIVAFFMPRLALALIFLFTHWFSRAFHSMLWPLLGFLLMPYTTLAWMAMKLNGSHPIWVGLLVVAVLFDLGGQGRSVRRKRRGGEGEAGWGEMVGHWRGRSVAPPGLWNEGGVSSSRPARAELLLWWSSGPWGADVRGRVLGAGLEGGAGGG